MAFDFITVSVTGIAIPTTGTSASATLPLDSAGAVPRFVRISATFAACVRLGTGAQTAVTTDLQVQPGDSVIVSTNGRTHIGAIQVAAAGVVQVSPVENT